MAASALDDMTVFREYEPHELRAARYPLAWDQLGDGHDDLLNAADMVLPGSMVGVKDIVRQVAGHRCQRCGHPYYVGKGLGVWETIGPAGADPSAFLTTAQCLVGLGQDTMALDKPTRVHWSPCDIRCTHGAPTRWRRGSEVWIPDGDLCAADSIGHGVSRGYEIQAAYRILTVHHLNERKHDLRWWNLAALCQRCHLTIQRKVTMEIAYPWEHTPWFRPHAAAWYALRYLGEHLTYTETITRLDELLALGRGEEAMERMAL